MKNNQINGSEHARDIKTIIKNHPSLTKIDFSNAEMNVNKNKLKNIGAQAIIEGILETNGASIISEINLSYNFLNHECLNYFALLSDPKFIQLLSLNLSFNDLGSESFKILGPIMSNLLELNLSYTKLNNQSMADFTNLYVIQEMPLQSLDIHGNNITSDGFFILMKALKTNNKIKHLNLSKNKVATDLKKFKIIVNFLVVNKILESLNLSQCEIKEQGAIMIGKGLRGNRNL